MPSAYQTALAHLTFASSVDTSLQLSARGDIELMNVSLIKLWAYVKEDFISHVQTVLLILQQTDRTKHICSRICSRTCFNQVHVDHTRVDVDACDPFEAVEEKIDVRKLEIILQGIAHKRF